MTIQQTPAPTEADARAKTQTESGAEVGSGPRTGADTETENEAEFVPMHEDDYICEELSEEFGEVVWIYKPTGRPYFQDNDPIRSWAKLPVLDHDDPFLQFLRGEIDL